MAFGLQQQFNGNANSNFYAHREPLLYIYNIEDKSMLPSPKLLLIDDDEDDRFLITEAFKSTNLNVQITEAASGTDALAVIKLMRPLPSLIVVDMNMPGMAGTETIEKLRLVLDKAPIVLLTTSLTGDLAIEAIELGANACFNKPMTFNDMCSLVNQLHRRFLQH